MIWRNFQRCRKTTTLYTQVVALRIYRRGPAFWFFSAFPDSRNHLLGPRKKFPSSITGHHRPPQKPPCRAKVTATKGTFLYQQMVNNFWDILCKCPWSYASPLLEGGHLYSHRLHEIFSNIIILYWFCHILYILLCDDSRFKMLKFPHLSIIFANFTILKANGWPKFWGMQLVP